MAWQTIRTVYEELGSAGEIAVADLIRTRGHAVRLDGGNHRHDIVLDGSTTVEVKTALPSPPANGGSDRWQFRLWEDDGQHAPMEEDILILRCQTEREAGAAVYHYVIPGCLIPCALKRIDITSHPAQYAGKYSLFLEAWGLLDALVALRNHAGRQVPLPTAEPIPF